MNSKSLTLTIVATIATSIAITAVITVAGLSKASAQDRPLAQGALNYSAVPKERKFSLGVFGGVALVQHNAHFPELNGVTVFSPRGDGQEPPNFGNTSTVSFAIGVVAEYKLTQEFTIGLRIGYAPQNSSFLTSHQRRFGNRNGASELGTIKYSLATTVYTLGAEPFVKYYILEGLHVTLGTRVNLALSSNYVQSETLISPSTGGFTPTFSKIANERSGDAIPDVSIVQVAGVLGVGYDVSFGERLVISPEVLYSLGFIPVVANLSWRVNDLRAGVSLRFRF